MQVKRAINTEKRDFFCLHFLRRPINLAAVKTDSECSYYLWKRTDVEEEEDEITRLQESKQRTKRDESRVHQVLSLFCLQTV